MLRRRAALGRNRDNSRDFSLNSRHSGSQRSSLLRLRWSSVWVST